MNFNNNTRLLVVAAHPDDEVLGCGGTILKAKEAGATVAVLFLGEGISARFPIGKYDSQKFKNQTQQRIKENAEKKRIKREGIERRKKELEKNGVIQGYRASIDVSFLGYRYYKSYINFLNTNRLKELQQFCLEHLRFQELDQ